MSNVKTIVKCASSAMASALRSVVSSKIPLVIVLGATGTGKTKLGVELAQKFGSEIISADSMQIYKGLDVVTAKASKEEREMAPHHLLDILEPHQEFTVVDFRSRALKIIDKLIEQGKMPVVVGGTNYYIESIVYKILVEEMNDPDALLFERQREKRRGDDLPVSHTPRKQAKNEDEESHRSELASTVDEKTQDEDKTTDIEIDRSKVENFYENEKNYTNEEIHNQLKAIDPEMALRLHVNNRRKVLRSIEVWLKSGRRHSEVLDEQKLSEGHLRRPGSTILLWLQCEQKVHDERLDARVDAMLRDGLIAELQDFHSRHNQHRIQDKQVADYTKGIFQTLGFKEFHEYLMIGEEERQSDEGRKLLQVAIENMRIGTRRYARRQNKMIRARFLDHPTREVPLIYALDTTDLSQWDEQVKSKAFHIIESYLNNGSCKYEPLKPRANEALKNINPHLNNYCEICERTIIGEKEYGIHMNSNRHKRAIKAKSRIEKEKNEEQCSK